MALLDELRHAFAVESAGTAEPNEAQMVLIDQLCHEVARRRLTTLATLFLEMSRPLGYLTAQTIHFFTPIINLFTDRQGHREIAEFLEHRGAIEYLLNRLEAIDQSDSPRSHGVTGGRREHE